MNQNAADGLSYEQFRILAQDTTKSRNEKIGFPDEYRQGYETVIISDIISKLCLDSTGISVVDIGCGCSGLVDLLIENSVKYDHCLTLLDSPEMLGQLTVTHPKVKLVSGAFHSEISSAELGVGQWDAVLLYTVLQYAFSNENLFGFFDALLKLLAPGGRLLIGDIPNISMRKRFFSSNLGIKTHKHFTQSNERPEVVFNKIEEGFIDDAVIFSLLMRARLAGYHAFVLPQADNCPMSSRREDLLIYRP